MTAGVRKSSLTETADLWTAEVMVTKVQDGPDLA